MRGWAFGLLRIRPDDFGLMRPGVFWEALSAYRKEKDMDRAHVGELVRGAALRLLNIQLAKQDRYTDPAEFWPMPWDTGQDGEEGSPESMTPEQRERNARAFLKRINWNR